MLLASIPHRCGAPTNCSPARERWVSYVVEPQPRRGDSIEGFAGVDDLPGSVAPPGLVSVSEANPQLTLWAIVRRCSAPGATGQRDAPTQEPALENEWRGS